MKEAFLVALLATGSNADNVSISLVEILHTAENSDKTSNYIRDYVPGLPGDATRAAVPPQTVRHVAR